MRARGPRKTGESKARGPRAREPGACRSRRGCWGLARAVTRELKRGGARERGARKRALKP